MDQAPARTDEELQTQHPGDLARRVAHRRKELGKSIEEVATQAGIDPGYLEYFEENASARLSYGAVNLLALALQTTPDELYGSEVRHGLSWAPEATSPELRELTPEQCQAHLNAGVVGRIIFDSERGPIAYPVNFATFKGDIVVSTTVAGAGNLAAQNRVGFLVDRADEPMREGWSVLATGSARYVDDPDEVVELSALGLQPWAGGARRALVRITPDEVTGRVIIQHNAP